MKQHQHKQRTETMMSESLARMGVSVAELSGSERERLDKEGFLLLTGIIEPAWLAELQTAFEQLAHMQLTAGEQPGGTRHIRDLAQAGGVFERVYTEPKLLAIVDEILGCPFRLAQLHGRDPLPGFGQQGLHADWLPRVPGEPYRIVTALWLLDDFTVDNGATRLVAGTHRLLTPPPKSLAAPNSRHPEQQLITARAGSVLIFNGHLWHSGTQNRSKQSRRALQCQFVARNEPRFHEITQTDPEILSPIARYMLGL